MHTEIITDPPILNLATDTLWSPPRFHGNPSSPLISLDAGRNLHPQPPLTCAVHVGVQVPSFAKTTYKIMQNHTKSYIQTSEAKKGEPSRFLKTFH